MPAHPDQLPTLGGSGDPCAACAAPLASDQRYCLECGARRGPARLDPLALARRADRRATRAVPAAPPARPPVRAAPGMLPALLALGRPRVLAAASTLVLGFGVAVGAAAGPPDATGLPLVRPPQILVAATPAPATATTPAAVADTSSSGDAGRSVDTAATASADAAALPAGADLTTPPPTANKPTPAAGGGAPAPAATPASPAPVKHVWLVVLREAPPAPAFAADTTTPVVPDLVAGGTVLSRYASIAPGALANGIALLSGQAPTPATLAECPAYADVAPGRIAAKTGLVSGDGCVYPPRTVTLADQLTGAGLSWKAYAEDVGAAPPPAATSCRHPDSGAADPFALPRPGDAYLTSSDPFVYFHSIADSPDCGSGVVGLDRLTADLATTEQTPAFSYVAPNACHDGSAAPCAEGAPAGLQAASAWLTGTVPAITASPAYRDGGLVVITFAGPPRGATATAESSSAPKGAAVGALLLSPYVAAGARIDAPYDHYGLLKTIERIFGLPPLAHAADKHVAALGPNVFVNAPAAGSS